MFKYLSIKEEICSNEAGRYTTYGIKGYTEENSRWMECIYISDVSLEKDLVDYIAKISTEEQLDPIHLEDVIIDFIG